MSDVMFYGVLRMPLEMAMADEMSRYQFWQRAQEAADRVASLEAELDALKADIERYVAIASQQEAKLAALEKQEPVAWVTHRDREDIMPRFHRTKVGALYWGADPVPLYLSAGSQLPESK